MSQPSSNNSKDIEERMNALLERLGLSFKVEWVPDQGKKAHANINLKQHVIHIFDVNEASAWESLLHEVFELRFRRITTLYQNVINNLIEVIEKQVYHAKEEFLNELPNILSEFQKERGIENAERAEKYED